MEDFQGRIFEKIFSWEFSCVRERDKGWTGLKAVSASVGKNTFSEAERIALARRTAALALVAYSTL